MNRIKKFLGILESQGISATCNWQMERGNDTIKHYTIRDGQRFCMVLFTTYKQSEGFHTYIETGNNTFAEDIDTIKNQLNADV